MVRKDSDDFLLVDTHVHIHSLFSLDKFFDSAFLNFQNAAQKYFSTENFTGILCLTESYNADYFNYLKEQIPAEAGKGNFKNAEWKILQTEERNSLIAEKNEEYKLIIIAGRQIISKENLEVLAIGTTKKFEDRLNLTDIIQQIHKDGAVPVLPWGVGKWMGKRGKVIKQFIEEGNKFKYFLGDNSGRPNFGFTPKLFIFAHKKGLKILRGTDPLPFSYQQKKIGSFGFSIKADIDTDHPAEDLKKIFYNLQEEPHNYGKLETPFNFFRNQIIMQLRKKGK